VGVNILGLKFLFGHEIQRSTLQKFADHRDTKCSVIGLATLVEFGPAIWKCPPVVGITYLKAKGESYHHEPKHMKIMRHGRVKAVTPTP